MDKTSMARNISIDTLRGLACILLVAFHVVGWDPSSGLTLEDSHPLSQLNDILAYLRMPLFSFLSGFVYAWRPYSGEPVKFLKGKVRRLLVPMLVVGTFFAVLQSLTPGTNAPDYDWRLLHIIPVAHYWFLESIFIIFMLIACLERFNLLSTPGRFAGIWLVAGLLFLFNPMTNLFGLAGAAFLLPFFLLGLSCNRFHDKIKRNHVVFGTAALGGLCLYLLVTSQALPGATSLAALLLGGGGCIVLLRINFQSPWLASIGYYSFAIYLFHTMFTAASRIVSMLMGINSVALLFGNGLVLGIVGPILVSTVLRRVPLGYWVLGESSKVDFRSQQSYGPAR
ncbi:MAG: acyltransferase [Polaromonas sp.]